MASVDKEKLGADLSAYLDGELSPERTREIERLLKESEDVRRALTELRGVSRDLGDLPRMHAPAGLPESVRRAADRRVGPRQRSPVGGARVLKLFTRIVASAAVIAVCTFAGWTLHDRLTPPTFVSREIATPENIAAEGQGEKLFARRSGTGKSARSEVAAPDAPAVAMRNLQSLGYIGTDETELADLTPAIDTLPPYSEPMVAVAELDLEQDGTIRASEGVTPAVNVVVSPRDVNEFNAALQIVAALQGSLPGATGRLGGARFGALSEQKGASTAPGQREFIVQVPPNRVGEVLQSLEQQAPRQVQVAMQFSPSDISQVRRMMAPPAVGQNHLTFDEARPTPTEAAPAFARAETPTRVRGGVPSDTYAFKTKHPTGRRGGRGRVMRQPSQPKSAEQREEVVARPSREALDAEASRSSGQADDSGKVEPKYEPPRDTKKDSPDARCPRVVDVAKPVFPAIKRRSATPAIEDKLADERTAEDTDTMTEAPRAGIFLRERTRELRDCLDEIYKTMLDAARRTSSEQQQSVTLHVTILPPPRTTQPAPASTPEKP